MSDSWPAGSVFAVFWLVVWVPIFLCGMVWFSRRRGVQPIKARSPNLVLVTDAILLLYTISLCFQRIAAASYPCMLNLWSGYIGTVILMNSYLWRCWTLYFNFNLTHVRLHSPDTASDSFFMRHRHLTSGRFLSRLALAVFVALMVPPLALSVTRTDIAHEYGDGCDQAWGPTLLAVYVGVYIALFACLSFSLRSVVDGFRIKSELKLTGFIALGAVVPWFVFNNALKDINTHTFPFSTMFLLMAAAAAFCASTIYPLYASLSQTRLPARLHGSSSYGEDGKGVMPLVSPGSDSSDSWSPDSGPLDRLAPLLASPSGLEAFTSFLSKEFSVENIQFYCAVEAFRRSIRVSRDEHHPDAHLRMVSDARRLYARFIAVGAPFQVNLPDPVVRNCAAHLRYEAHLVGVSMEGLDAPPSGKRGGKAAAVPEPTQMDWSVAPPAQQPPVDHVDRSTPTLFDDSQRTIFQLMEKDSMLRFVRSELYTNWVRQMQEEQHKNKVLSEMGLV